MTNTKWLSALLAGTALAVASSAAMADSSLLTISPVADMPASATEVSISGELRVVGSFLNSSNDDAETDMGSRLRVVVQGSTETSVGTVGAYARLEQSNGNDNSSNQVTANKAYGYWQATPEWQILAGRTDSIGAIEAGLDWNLNASLFSYEGGPTNATTNQVRATYTTGPLSWAIAFEDTAPGIYSYSDGDQLAIGTALKYSAGTGIDVVINGITQEDNGDEADYFVGAGVNTSFNNVAVTAAVGTGEGYQGATYATIDTDEAYTVASLGLTFGVSEATSVEVGMAYTDTDDYNDGVTDINAALLWSPVGQLTLGAGIGYTDYNDGSTLTSGGLGAWFKF